MASATVRHVLVETAAKRTRMRRWRAHTGLLGERDGTAVALNDLVTVWGDGAVVDGEADGRGERRGVVEVYAGGRGRSLMLMMGVVVAAVVVMAVKVVVEESRRCGIETGACRGSEG